MQAQGVQVHPLLQGGGGRVPQDRAAPRETEVPGRQRALRPRQHAHLSAGDTPLQGLPEGLLRKRPVYISERRIRFCTHVALFAQRLFNLKASLVILIR